MQSWGYLWGGGKGGVQVNPKELSETELEKLSRAYMRAGAEAGIFGPDIDIPAPDVNTNAQIMDWMRDEYEKIVGHSEPAVITGKSVNNGGSLGRNYATSLGGFYALEQLRTEVFAGKKSSDLTIAIQGFGNAGAEFSRIACQNGYRVIAVSDSRGGSYCQGVCDLQELRTVKSESGTVSTERDGISIINNEELLEVDADILVLAALDGAVNDENAKNVKARLILELANGPVTNESERILTEKGTTVVPDILANGGGVTVSYFEWLQNKSGENWEENVVNEKLKEVMEKSTKEVVATADEYNTTLRLGAYILGIKRILDQQ